MKDPLGANLDRVQIVKGWLDDQGVSREKVFDIAWAGDRERDADGRLPDLGNTVNLVNASYTNTIGEAQFSALWQDPVFSPGQSAFYYVRILQIPTPRHSLYDVVALNADVDTRRPDSIQERAYTSPIWYQSR